MNTVLKTYQLINIDTLEASIDLLNNASTIYLFGVGGSFIAEESENVHYTNMIHNQPTFMIAEDKDSYKVEKDSE